MAARFAAMSYGFGSHAQKLDDVGRIISMVVRTRE